MAREDESTIRDGYGYAEAVIDAADELCEHIVEICEREYAPRTLFDMKEAPARAGKQGAEARP